jgi:HK97 family phage major capsid protein
MTVAESRRKAAEARERALAIINKADSENRDLNDDEQAELDAAKAEAEGYDRRAKVREEAEAAVAEDRKSAGRVSKPVAGTVVEATEVRSGDDKPKHFRDFLVCVAIMGDTKAGSREKQWAHEQLENRFASRYNQWDTDDRNKEVRAMAMSSGTSGGYTVPTGFRNELMKLAGPMSIVRPRAMIIPMDLDEIDIPVLDQTTAQSAGVPPYYGGIIAGWSAEAAQIGSTDAAFRQVKLSAHELTGYTAVSRTLLANSAISVEALLYQLFAGAVAWYEDYAFLRGDGIGKPLGVLNAKARIKTSARGSATVVTFANFTDVWVRVLPESQESGVWVASKAVEAQVIKATASANSVFAPAGVYITNTGNINAGPSGGASGVTLFQRPVVVSTKLPGADVDGDINFFDFSKYLVGDRVNLEIAASEHYLFRNNQMAFRFVHRVAGMPWMNDVLTMEDASTTLSPFVSLGIQ